MIKYFKICWMLMRNSYIRDSKISGHIFSVVLFHLAEIVITVIFLKILFTSTQALAGWSFHQTLFLYALTETISHIHAALTRAGTRAMAVEYVRTGEFDFYLTKPIDSMFLVSVSKPRVLDFITVCFYSVLGAYAISAGNITIGALNLAWFLVLVFFGLLLYYYLQIITLVPVFWVVKTYSLQFFMNRVSQFMRYPVGILPFILKVVLMAIFPILIISYIPVFILFYSPKYEYIVYMFAITIIFGFISRLLWNFGLKNYSSASS